MNVRYYPQRVSHGPLSSRQPLGYQSPVYTVQTGRQSPPCGYFTQVSMASAPSPHIFCGQNPSSSHSHQFSDFNEALASIPVPSGIGSAFVLQTAGTPAMRQPVIPSAPPLPQFLHDARDTCIGPFLGVLIELDDFARQAQTSPLRLLRLKPNSFLALQNEFDCGNKVSLPAFLWEGISSAFQSAGEQSRKAFVINLVSCSSSLLEDSDVVSELEDRYKKLPQIVLKTIHEVIFQQLLEDGGNVIREGVCESLRNVDDMFLFSLRRHLQNASTQESLERLAPVEAGELRKFSSTVNAEHRLRQAKLQKIDAIEHIIEIENVIKEFRKICDYPKASRTDKRTYLERVSEKLLGALDRYHGNGDKNMICLIESLQYLVPADRMMFFREFSTMGLNSLIQTIDVNLEELRSNAPRTTKEQEFFRRTKMQFTKIKKEISTILRARGECKKT